MFFKILLIGATSFLNSGSVLMNKYHQLQQNEPETKIIDFATVMRNAVEWEYHMSSAQDHKVVDSYDDFEFVDIDGNQKDPVVTNMKVIPIGQPNIIYEDKNFNYMGHSVLTNSSAIAQTGSTPVYQKSISSEVSILTSIGISCEASCNFEIFDSKVSTNINTTNVETSTVTKTYEIPPQNIIIPPKSQITVDEYWSQVKMNQKVQVDCDISGYAMGRFHVHYPSGRRTVVDMILPFAQDLYVQYFQYWYPDCPDQITINPDGESIHFTGQIDCWDSGAGSSFNLNIGNPEPIPN